MCYNPIKIPMPNGTIKTASCRKCIECLQVRANEWGLRCHFELKDHQNNCFITLTYSENPIYLVKSEVQKFIKRLRKKIAPTKIKYFSCGEYGDRGLRPHFHLIIFGYDFHDKKYVKMSASNKAIYYSEELDKIWGYGMCTVQEANVQTVRYSAKYSTKHKNNLPTHLKDFPEFNTMSQSLGIKPLLKKMDMYLQTDEIYIDGFKYIIPNLLLEKYAKSIIPDPIHLENGYGVYTSDDWVKDFKQSRKYDYVSEEKLKQRKRLAEKRKQHSQLRAL